MTDITLENPEEQVHWLLTGRAVWARNTEQRDGYASRVWVENIHPRSETPLATRQVRRRTVTRTFIHLIQSDRVLFYFVY